MNDRQTEEARTIRHLFWPLLFLCLSVHINFFGALDIDFLPDIVGYYIIADVLKTYGGVLPRKAGVQVCLWVAALATLPSWVPSLWSGVYAPVQTAVTLVGMAAQIVVLRRIFTLLIALCRVNAREDLAGNGERFRQLYTAGGIVICLGIVLRGGLTGGVYVLQLIFTLSAAVYAANCSQALLPPETGKEPQSE